VRRIAVVREMPKKISDLLLADRDSIARAGRVSTSASRLESLEDSHYRTRSVARTPKNEISIRAVSISLPVSPFPRPRPVRELYFGCAAPRYRCIACVKAIDKCPAGEISDVGRTVIINDKSGDYLTSSVTGRVILFIRHGREPSLLRSCIRQARDCLAIRRYETAV